ncbi:MAG: glycosyltransferase [Candidatus Omnitrophota bacterium]
MNELSVIIPCISTTELLPALVDELAGYLMANPSDVDIIVVANEKSYTPNNLSGYVQSNYPWLKFEMLQLKGGRRSFGALARFGIAYSTSSYVVLVSGYGEDDIGIIPKMLNQIRNGAQVVQATRSGSLSNKNDVSFKFRLYQALYRFLIKLLLGIKIKDSTYGFKMFDRVFIQSLGLNQNGFSICPEITLKALLAGGRVEYVDSKVKSKPLNKDFKLYKEGISYLWLLLRGFAHRLGILWF